MRVKIIIAVVLLFTISFSWGCRSEKSFNDRLQLITEPYIFSILEWEWQMMVSSLDRIFQVHEHKIEDEIILVRDYFSIINEIDDLNWKLFRLRDGSGQGDVNSTEAELLTLIEKRNALEDSVEVIIERQIRDILISEGIFNPIDNYLPLKVSLPPINFELEEPPKLLVVSPRDKIQSLREITLLQGISLGEIQKIEHDVGELDVSSLVVELGGLGATYPTFVTNDASLRFTINTAIEEWLHQYLAFKPLGFLYILDVLGIAKNYEVATINETFASMFSKELGSIVCQRFYPLDGCIRQAPADADSEFNRLMRQIRIHVDELLLAGQVEQAESYMEEQRQLLVSKGYYIRKLNQAYFAFHGTYADRPTSVSPIGAELGYLREQSSTLRIFLNTAAMIRNRADLINLVGR